MKQRFDYDMPTGHGVIVLYDWNSQVVRGMKYKSKSHRKEIISMWRKEYAANFNRCYLHILPSAKPENVGELGVNTYSQFNPRKKSKAIGGGGYKISIGKNANKFYE